MTSSENLLYNVYNHNDWCVESEEITFRLPYSFNVSVWSILRTAGSLIRSNVNNVVFPLNQIFLRIKEFSLDWKVDYHDASKLLAVASEREVFLLSFESGFSTVLASHQITRDYNPKWALLQWAPNGGHLIHTSSKAHLTVFDRKLSQIASISIYGAERNLNPLERNTLDVFDTVDNGNCVCAIAFKEESSLENAFLNIYCLSFRGLFNSFIFDYSLNDLQKYFTVNLSSFYINGGVFSMIFSKVHDIFVTGSCFDMCSEEIKDSTQNGLHAWKLVAESPWLLNFALNDKNTQKMRNKPWFGKGTNSEQIDGAFRLILSGDERTVFSCNWMGTVSQWSMPGLLLIRRMSAVGICQSPLADTEASTYNRSMTMLRNDLHDSVNNLQLWGDEEVVFMKFSGLTDLQNITSMESVIGKCEKFPPTCEITKVFETDGGHKAFIGLELEKKVSTIKRKFRLSDSSDNEDDDDDDDDDSDAETPETYKQQGSRYLKQGLYFLTESDHFQPPKKKPKLITKTYRIFSFQSTTPEALFKIKLQNEEFGEALTLAKMFNLDADLVYMRQWRKYPVSNATIQDYLRKISKRHWILRECVNRTSNDLDAMKALLNYGLIGTEVEVVLDIGNKSAQQDPTVSNFDLRVEEDILTEDDYAFLSRQEVAEKKAKYRKEKVKDLLTELEKVDALNSEQKEILRTRLRLVHYLHTLILYEEVLGGAEKASQKFSADEFSDLRDQTWLKTTIDFAQSCDWQAVDTMFMHVKELEQYRLLILSNFPETTDISEIAELLPSVSDNGRIKILFMCEQFESDWIESQIVKKLFDEELKLNSVDKNQIPKILLPEKLTPASCGEWFKYRAREIESCTGLLKNACDLLKHGVDSEIPGVIQLVTDMQLLNDFVCDKQANMLIQFSEFEAMSDFDKLNVIVQSATSESIVKDVRKFVKPRLNTLSGKKHEELFRQLLISISIQGLDKLVRIFEASKPKTSEPLETNQLSLMRNAVDCVYNCPRTDQLSQAYAILNCLPLRSSGNYGPQYDQVFEDIDSLEIHLEAASILNKFEISKSVVFYKQVQYDKVESLKILNELMATLVKQERKMSSEDWLNFLVHDLLQLQAKLMKKLSGQECFRIFITQILRADNSKLTKLALRFMALSQSEKTREFSYATAANFKLSFKESTEVLLNVAQEFVDSASSVNDSSLLGAVSLLKTIHSPPKFIQDEKDFIEMLTKLQQYSCSLLPVVIRDKYDYESLVKYVLKENVGAYTNWTKILKIATLFKSPTKSVSNDEKKARVCAIIAESALADKYIDLALEMCLQLIDLKYRKAWTFCWTLVQNEELKDLEVKLKLLAFTMCYCDEQVLTDVVRMNNRVMIQVTSQKVDEAQLSSKSESTVKLFPVLGTLEKTGKEFFKETQDSTQKFLTSQGISFHGDTASASSFSDYGLRGIHFLDTDLVSAESIKMFDHEIAEPSQCFKQLVERPYWDVANEENDSETLQKSLLDCALECFDVDLTLSLFFLLACNSEASVDSMKSKLPQNERSSSFLLLAYTLLRKTNDSSRDFDVIEMVNKKPYDLINSEVNALKTESENCSSPVLKALEKLQSLVEASKLGQLVSEVDTSRFSTDEEYKTSTILGLAANTDPKLVALSLELAERHKVDVYKVRLHTLLHVLTDSKYRVNDIKRHLKEMNLIEDLKSKPEDVVKLLETEVLPLIHPSDFEKLKVVFEILKSGNVTESRLCQKAELHIEVLTATQKLAPSLPYKDLIKVENDCDLNELVSKYCTQKNFTELSQTLAKVPNTAKPISRSKILYFYSSRLFYELEHKSSNEYGDLINSVKSCIDLMQLEDVQHTANLVAFQEDDIRVTDLPSVLALVRKCLAVCRKSKKKSAHSETIQNVEQIFEEIEKLNNAPFMNKWFASDNEIKRSAAKAFWLSRGDIETQKEVLMGLVLAQIPFEAISEAMKSLKVGFELTEVIENVMSRCMEDIAMCQNIELVETSKPLVSVLTNVKSHLNSEDEKSCAEISEGRIIAKLREVTSIPNLSTEAKIFILERIEHLFNLNEQDLKSLLHARTRNLIGSLFSESVFTEDDLSSESGRYDLICDLLDCSVNSAQFAKLVELIDAWPAFKSYPGNQHPLVAVACKWIQTDSKEAMQTLKKVVESKLSDFAVKQCFASVVDFCLDSGNEECAVVFGLRLKTSTGFLLILNSLNWRFSA